MDHFSLEDGYMQYEKESFHIYDDAPKRRISYIIFTALFVLQFASYTFLKDTTEMLNKFFMVLYAAGIGISFFNYKSFFPTIKEIQVKEIVSAKLIYNKYSYQYALTFYLTSKRKRVIQIKADDNQLTKIEAILNSKMIALDID